MPFERSNGIIIKLYNNKKYYIISELYNNKKITGSDH